MTGYRTKTEVSEYAALGVFISLIENRSLVYQLTRRNIAIRFRGAALGVLWSLFTPILMLAVYTFVFGTILEIRWIEQKGGNLEFATILFSGLIIHSYFSECLQSSVQLITDNRQYVKKVVFPLEALAWVAILTSLFQVAVSTGVLLLYLLLVQGALSWTIIFLPIILAPLMLFALGISWIISSTAVYLRDIGQLVGPITLILLFVSPIFYPVSSIPSEFQFLLYLNPITWVVDQVRNAMLWGLTPYIQGYLVYLVFAFLVSWIGFSVFKKLRPGFSDVV